MDISLNNSSDPLAIIYNEGTWRLCKLSPLYNLEYNSVRFKQYASKIRQELTSAVAVKTSVKYAVQFQPLPLLKYSENDPDGIIISVSALTDAKGKVPYIAVLLSWGICSNLDGATHLPFMLERGEQRLGTSVRATLQRIFDCHIKQYTFTQHHLLQFGMNFIDSNTSRSNDQFTMLYKLPQSVVNHKLTLSFDVGDVRAIWNDVKDEGNQPSELVNIAYQILQNQIFSIMSLDISTFDICEVALPTAEVKNNGIIKMKTPEVINCVFTVLNEISDIYNANEAVSGYSENTDSNMDV